MRIVLRNIPLLFLVCLLSGCGRRSIQTPPDVAVKISIERDQASLRVNRSVTEFDGLTGETVSGALLPNTHHGGRYTFFYNGEYIGDVTHGFTADREFLLYWHLRGKVRLELVDVNRAFTNRLVLEGWGSKVLQMDGE